MTARIEKETRHVARSSAWSILANRDARHASQIMARVTRHIDSITRLDPMIEK